MKYIMLIIFLQVFDLEKGNGAIKLYKINFKNQTYNITIDLIQDIILEKEKNFENFNGAITSIIQANNTGDFLISCFNGNIYLFSPANINYFLFYDGEEKKGLNYEEIKNFEKRNKKIQKQSIDNKKMLNNLIEILKSNISLNLDFLR